MRIKAITFQPYGCFTEKTVKFNETLNVVYGPNEAGKTTLFNGLKTVLYGFTPATREKNPYVSWDTEQAKLSAMILSNGELFSIERRLMSAPKCFVKNEVTQQVQTLRNEPFKATHPVSEALYVSAFHLRAEDLENPSGTGWHEISQKLLHAIEVPYLNPVSEVLQDLESERVKLKRDDRRGTPEIPVLEKKLYQLEREIRQCVDQEKRFQSKKTQLQEFKFNLSSTEKRLAEVKAKILRFTTLQEVYQWYERSGLLETQFDLESLTLLQKKEHLELQLEHLDARITDLQNLKAARNKNDIEVLKNQLNLQYESLFNEKLDRDRFSQIQSLELSQLWELVEREPFMKKWAIGCAGIALIIGGGSFIAARVIDSYGAIFIVVGLVCVAFALYGLVQHRRFNQWHRTVSKQLNNRMGWVNRFSDNPSYFVSRMELLKFAAQQVYQSAAPSNSEDEKRMFYEMDSVQEELEHVKGEIQRLGEGDYHWGYTRLEQMKSKHKDWLSAKEMFIRLHENHPLTESDLAFMSKHTLEILELEKMALESEALSSQENIAIVQKEMESLQTTDQMFRLNEERDKVKALLSASIQRYDILRVSSALLRKSHRIYQETHQPDILKKASVYFDRLTLGKYHSILFENVDESLCLFVEKEGEIIPFKETFSKGTIQQLFLSLRLAFIDVMDPDKKLPLVLDEAMNAWDAERIERGAALIQEIAKERQVFVLTCHQHLVKCFDEIHCIQL